MKIDSGTLFFGSDNQHLAYWVNEWSQLFGKYNWFHFTLIRLDCERDLVVPGFELVFIILGLGFRIRWNDDWEGTEFGNRLKDLEQTISAEKELKSVDEPVSSHSPSDPHTS